MRAACVVGCQDLQVVSVLPLHQPHKSISKHGVRSLQNLLPQCLDVPERCMDALHGGQAWLPHRRVLALSHTTLPKVPREREHRGDVVQVRFI